MRNLSRKEKKGAWTCRELNPVDLGYQSSLANLPGPRRFQYIRILVHIRNSSTGQIDDVKIFNYALSASQVKNLFNNGAVYFGPVTGSP